VVLEFAAKCREGLVMKEKTEKTISTVSKADAKEKPESGDSTMRPGWKTCAHCNGTGLSRRRGRPPVDTERELPDEHDYK
jgi:hypothetical protein